MKEYELKYRSSDNTDSAAVLEKKKPVSEQLSKKCYKRRKIQLTIFEIRGLKT
jgi:hypothetical protein